MQYRITGWGGPPREPGAQVAKENKKYVKFISDSQSKTIDAVGADIDMSSDDQGRDQGMNYPAKPSKTRYQPGKDREQHRKKK